MLTTYKNGPGLKMFRGVYCTNKCKNLKLHMKFPGSANFLWTTTKVLEDFPKSETFLNGCLIIKSQTALELG